MISFNNIHYLHDIDEPLDIDTDGGSLSNKIHILDNDYYLLSKQRIPNALKIKYRFLTTDENLIPKDIEKLGCDADYLYKHKIGLDILSDLKIRHVDIKNIIIEVINEANGKFIINNIDFKSATMNYDSGIITVDKNNMKAGRFLKKYTNLNDVNIELVSKKLKFDPVTTHIETLSGDDIYEAYKSSNSKIIDAFTLNSSCFKDKPKEFYELFTMNSAFNLLVLKETESDKVLSRTILYKTNNGLFHDNHIYSSSQAIDEYFKKQIARMGIDSFKSSPIDTIVNLDYPTITTYKSYPGYLDTPLLSIVDGMFKITKRPE